MKHHSITKQYKFEIEHSKFEILKLFPACALALQKAR
jgi:hypothetical protein